MLSEQVGQQVGGTAIAFVCRAAHSTIAKSARDSSSPVTVHEGRWAYCRRAAVSGHEWHPIEPVELATLRLREAAKHTA